ncbi:hypothetical protein DCAR_0623939 [Daucus carota subsp. sativus]|uniref:Uncharacterized protein n=1 Tax=Daucus carota subsp. sativus TaxID=79200 RepID=A0A164VIE8_DAUCS|nr:PREDICTED: uncharacterized protein LOC108224408 [Daucus carota subsp. sativus]WOH04530.1 hypothetical protein DCAR_0623939 [Daucus carota subsp. sativus]
MESTEAKDPLKVKDWKNIGKAVADESSSESVVKKRLPKKVRNIPECYFLPRKTLPAAIAYYGSWILGGVGAGMLAEIWINKKVKEDGGGVVWEFGK